MKQNMLKIFITLFLICTYMVTFGQPSFTISDKENSELIKKSTLAVVAQSIDEKHAKKLKADELKLYRESVETFNSFVREAVEKYWTLSKFEFITAEEALKLRESKAANYFLLEATEVSNYKMGDFYASKQSNNNAYAGTPAMKASMQAADRAYHMSPSGASVALAIYPASKPNKELVISYLPLVGVSKGSTTFMILNLQNQINDCLSGINGMGKLRDDIEKREGDLKNKTLILFDPLISNAMQKTIDKKELNEFYPFPMEVASIEKVDQVIIEKDNQYAYVWVIPAGAVSGGKTLYNYFIVDGKDGRFLFLTGTSVIGANGDFHPYQLKMASKNLK